MTDLNSVNGLTGATAATDIHALAAIWNPSTTKRIWAHEVSVFAVTAPGAGAGFEVRRLTARGTPGSTITPVAGAVSHDDLAATKSGFVLDLAAYSVQPTTFPPAFGAFIFTNAVGSGIVMALRRICIPPGSGLALVNRAAIAIPACEVAFVIEE